MDLIRSNQIADRLHQLVPGGAHTYAKGDDQWPAGLAPVIASGRGARVTDVDGNQYIEYGSGLRSVILGHAHPTVNEAVREAIDSGTNFVRPSQLELEAAEQFLSLVPTMEMVKFAKNGSDATTAAVRLSRAATGRDMVAVCSDHPFFSTDDWFIGTTPMDAGVPNQVSSLTVDFRYGDISSLDELFTLYEGRIACLVMEVDRGAPPPKGYLEEVRERCDEHGTVLVFDEIITGFRWSLSGAHSLYGVVPDLAAFGKAMANGFSLAALAGRRDLMEMGGLRHSGDRVFLLSTTYGADSVGLVAGMATQRVLEEEGVVELLHTQGSKLRKAIGQITDELGVSEFFEVSGRDSCLLYATKDRDRRPSQEFRTLFMEQIVPRGLLAPSLVVSAGHDDSVIDETIDIIRDSLVVYAKALEDGVERHLNGRPVSPVFRRRN